MGCPVAANTNRRRRLNKAVSAIRRNVPPLPNAPGMSASLIGASPPLNGRSDSTPSNSPEAQVRLRKPDATAVRSLHTQNVRASRALDEPAARQEDAIRPEIGSRKCPRPGGPAAPMSLPVRSNVVHWESAALPGLQATMPDLETLKLATASSVEASPRRMSSGSPSRVFVSSGPASAHKGCHYGRTRSRPPPAGRK